MIHKTSLYQTDSLALKIFFIICLLGLFSVSYYLTTQFYEAHFPTSMESIARGTCHFNAFFSCDKTTYSIFSHLFGAPIALMGIAFVLVLSMGLFFPQWEESLAFIALINVIGCVILLLISLLVLKGLCPYCTLYYVLSFVVLGLFYYAKVPLIPKGKTLGFLAPAFGSSLILFFSIMSLGYGITKSKKDTFHTIQSQMEEQLQKANRSLTPSFRSPYRLDNLKTDFLKAPLRLSIFSDFQCPYCKELIPLVSYFAGRFKEKLAVEFFFYPMDSNCNIEVKHRFHPFACKASYVSMCLSEMGDPFSKGHDYIFENQDKISDPWLNALIQKNNIAQCVEKEENKQLVKKMIQEGQQLSIQATPTLIINGIMLPGIRPLDFYIALFQSLLKEKP